MSWLYDVLADNWTHWLPKDTIPTIKKYVNFNHCMFCTKYQPISNVMQFPNKNIPEMIELFLNSISKTAYKLINMYSRSGLTEPFKFEMNCL